MSDRVYQERARVAVLTRYRRPDDPDLLEARHRMRVEVLVDSVTKALSKAPPPTPAAYARLIDLLSTWESA